MTHIIKTTFATLIIALTTSTLAYGADAAAGKNTFTTLCASCHGPMGGGDGPVAAALPPEMKPRNLQEGKFKYATDAKKFKELLHKGGQAVGLSVVMPPQPQLSDAEIENLYAFLHTLVKK